MRVEVDEVELSEGNEPGIFDESLELDLVILSSGTI